MVITGKCKIEGDLTIVYADSVMYTISKKTEDWATLTVGETDWTGHLFTQEEYDRCERSCEKSGSFELVEPLELT